jgi:RNA-directed DNA polymerase
LTTREELAEFLGVTPEHLHFLAYTRKPRYRVFEIKKRRGGLRSLAEPIVGLKIVQQKLNQVLYALYRPRNGVHGYVRGLSLATNAQVHERRRWVLNLDLADFFPSIHFGRVRGMLMAVPYNIPAEVATIVAQLCCHDSKLPQGAPTSPVLANMVCARLDADLLRLARRARATYTRYADDITFSSDLPVISARLVADLSVLSSPRLSEELGQVISNNGFKVNLDKVRLQRADTRQMVTGLVVNRFPNVPREYVRELRAMLHDWKTKGLDQAASRFINEYDTKDRGPFKEGDVSFAAVVKGRIDYLGMVRGKTDSIYRKMLHAYAKLDDSYVPVPARYRRPNHLRTYRDAIWVLEGTGGQGTMFYLDEIGWITCDHVWTSKMKAYHPSASELEWPARKLIGDPDLDLAIVEIDAPSVYGFKPSPRNPVLPGDVVKLAGYPHYAPGATLWEDTGRVVANRHAMGYPRIMINVPTVTGASGGPVLDNRNLVLGIAATGGKNVDEAHRKNANSVIPIASVQILVERLRSAERERAGEAGAAAAVADESLVSEIASGNPPISEEVQGAVGKAESQDFRLRAGSANQDARS